MTIVSQKCGLYELVGCMNYWYVAAVRAAEVHTHRQQASLDDDVLSLVHIWTGITLAALAEESDAGICSSIATVNPSLEGSQSQFTSLKTWDTHKPMKFVVT